jgi:hypothetical protein
VRAGGARGPAARTPHPALRATFPLKGGRQGGGYCGEDAVEVLQDFVVPEAENPIASAFEKFGALRIVAYRFLMLAAVDLDDQTGTVRREVGVIRANWYLRAKMHPRKAPPKPRAQRSLRRSHLPPE